MNISLVACCLAGAVILFGGAVFGAESSTDGYAWKQMSGTEKVGYLKGYYDGVKTIQRFFIINQDKEFNAIMSGIIESMSFPRNTRYGDVINTARQSRNRVDSP